MTTSRDRILAAYSGLPADRVPLTTWCFGLPAPGHLKWRTGDREVGYWYSLRMEHIHTLPGPWTLEDDFNRARAWLSIGVDDLLDVSVPWSVDPGVQWRDSLRAAGDLDSRPVLVRDYSTPSGPLRHAVRQTGEDVGAGWVRQPETVWLFEDYNIPRAVKHAVGSASDVSKIRHLYAPPDEGACAWFADRMARVKAFADSQNVAVQAWSAFGMDAAVWLAGTDTAVLLAVDDPRAFHELMDIIAATDLARTRLAAAAPGVDIIVQRGWYSSTDFWSPAMFNEFVYPHVEKLASVAHESGKKFAYVMTTGVERLGRRLADAGVDVLYFVDPVQDQISLERARDLLAGRMTLVGGVNALTLRCGDAKRIRDEVRRAMEILAPTGRFVLHPVDAVFPDTRWEGIQAMIGAWREFQP